MRSFSMLLKSLTRPIRMPIYCLGDSHIAIFNEGCLRKRLPFAQFHTVRVDGATASGLPNPNSKTQAGAIFMDALKKIQDGGVVIVCLGEVDIGFVVWLRAERPNETLLRAFFKTVNHYKSFLQSIATRCKLVVLSAPLPTIRDHDLTTIVGNLRREVKATQKDRTRLTVLFNKYIERYCHAANIDYISLDADCMDSMTGIIKEEFRHPDKTNHHYSPVPYGVTIAGKLRKKLLQRWFQWMASKL